MGDRTTVYLTVLTEHTETVLDVFGENVFNDEDPDAAPGWTTFTAEQVNYGQLEELTDLRHKGVAYNSNWCDGDEYRAGTEYVRFTAEGQVLKKTVAEADADQVGIAYVLQVVRQQGQSLAGVEAFLLQRQEDGSEPSWDNQAEFGKRYRAARLIGGGDAAKIPADE